MTIITSLKVCDLVWETLASRYHSFLVPALRLPKSFYLLCGQPVLFLLVNRLPKKLGSQISQIF